MAEAPAWGRLRSIGPWLLAAVASLVLVALAFVGGTTSAPVEQVQAIEVDAPPPPAVEPEEAPAPPETPEPLPDPTTFRPVSMQIPALHVTAPMDAQVPDANNVLGVPSDPARLGWREAGALSGDDEGTLLAYGHVVNRGYGRGALYDLSELKVGDDILLTGPTGELATYRVVEASIIHKDEMPATEMLSTTGEHRLALYTCNGRPDQTGHRTYRVVVWAERVGDLERVVEAS